MQSELDTTTRPPGWQRLLLAPWLGMLRPAAAAEQLVAAPNRSFWLAYGAHAALLALLIVLLAFWDATVQHKWIPPPTPAATLPTGAPASNPAALGYVGAGWTHELESRTWAQVWQDWHAAGPIGPAESTFFLALVVTIVGTTFLGWLNLPRVYRAGPVAPAFWRAFRTVAAAGGLLITLTIVAGLLIVVLNHSRRLGGGNPSFLGDLLVFIGLPVAIALIIQRVGRAGASVDAGSHDPHLPSRCEGCGYDLTHQPRDARCPECGLAVAESVSHKRRPGCVWERSRRPAARQWLVTVLMAVLQPRQFYGRLRLHTPPARAGAFALRNYVAIGIGAGVWVLLMSWTDAAHVGLFVSKWDEVLALLLTFALWVPLVCWFGHRLVGAIVITYWIASRALPDTRWAAKVLAYEAAFLWVFCAFWGLLFSSFVLFGPWISNTIGRDFFYAVFAGSPGEVVVALAGTGLLALVWLWRYVIALRAIRWSNF